ncbi:MAG: aminotransferase class III-fold pyridoxal phosphate-dependent enzyme [Ilumatobacteraceae bacterium]
MATRHPSIGDVRGRGLFFGVELVTNRETREPLAPFNAKGPANAPMAEILQAGMERGLYLSSFSNVIRITPPLIISADELRQGVEILDTILELADRRAA